MLSKNQIKYINALKIKKFRQQYGIFLVEGEKCVDELLHSSLETTGIYALPDWLREHSRLLNEKNIGFTEIDETILEKISDLTTPNKVLALAKVPEQVMLPDIYNNYCLALDNIKDPGNMGTIIRTADWFGIRRIVCSPGCVDAFNPKVIQSTMGSFTRVNVFHMDLIQFIKQKPKDTPVYGALLQGKNLHQVSFNEAGIVIIGSESHGISADLLPLVTQAIYIPPFNINGTINAAESLNASIANAIICYEISKQLSEKKS